MLALSFMPILAKRISCILLASSVCLASNDAAADRVRISNLSDMAGPSWIVGDGAVVMDVFVCIYRENTTGSNRTYGIRATSSPTSFRATNGAQTITYTVQWNDGGAANPGGGTTANMVHNVKLASRQNARINTDLPVNSTDCNGGASPTARVRVTFSTAAMEAARSGNYTSTLTLVLTLT
jgi:hypothetical protein